MQSTMGDNLEHADDEANNEAAEIRYSLTALGESALADRKGARFRGFGPCAIAVLAGTIPA